VSLDIHPVRLSRWLCESGSGKTLTARSILRVPAKRPTSPGGQIPFNGFGPCGTRPRDPRLAKIRAVHRMIYQNR
jgi:ABC-type glutathione transport system ATPase component